MDLSTRYLDLELRSPIVASAGPATGDHALVESLVAAGVAAVVLPSLFEEEVLHEEMELRAALEAGAGHFAEALDYFPALRGLETVADRYLGMIERAKASLPVPVIASLNATTTGGWVRCARLIEAAGADALELNLYRVAADPRRSAAEMEESDLALVRDVRAALRIPLAVKLSPYYTALAHFAGRLVDAGADGIVLFNRFYQPDLDLETLEVVPKVDLSQSWELRLPLRWLAILRPLLAERASLAATTGIHSGADVAKALLVGADVAMMTSAVLRQGPHHVRAVEDELVAWMAAHDYDSVDQLRGSVSHTATDNPAAFERANYVRTLHSWAAPQTA